MDEKINLGEEAINKAKCELNNRTQELIKLFIDIFFDYIECKVKCIDISKVVGQLRNNPKIEQDISALWSEQLFLSGLVPKGYNGLPEELLISNCHQDGYLDGLYVGYILAMMALVDNGASADMILAIREYIRPYLVGHHYDSRNEFISQYKNEKYSWVERLSL